MSTTTEHSIRALRLSELIRRLTEATTLALVTVLLFGCPPPNQLTGIDISPNQPNETLPKNADGSSGYTAGITIAFAGDEKALYAVSLDAGVWRSENGGPWKQLENSPRYSYSI